MRLEGGRVPLGQYITPSLHIVIIKSKYKYSNPDWQPNFFYIYKIEILL